MSFGWRGSILILSGILAFLCICGLLIRDLQWPEDTLEYKTKRFDRIMDRESIKNQSRADESHVSYSVGIGLGIAWFMGM